MSDVISPEERASLRAHLLETLVAGPTRTPRDNAVRNAKLLAQGDPDKALGFDFVDLSVQEVMDAVAALCGCSPDPKETAGPGYIDPGRPLDERGAMAERLGDAAAAGERVLVCTGHPTGVMPMYMAVARSLAVAGCTVLTPRENERLPRDHHCRNPRVLY